MTFDSIHEMNNEQTPCIPMPEVSRKVLIVDDDEKILRSLQRTLRKEPYMLLVANGGNQALEVLDQETVQVVISDLGMPGMDGITFLSQVALQSPDSVRMVLSGHSDYRLIIDAINNGSVYRYILKPWDDDHLKTIIQQALTLWELKAERQYLFDALQEQNRHLEALVSKRTQQILAVERQADIGRYASQIVHNLNNPLHAVSCALELVASYVSNGNLNKEKLEKGLNLARSSADDLNKIIAGILSHSRETHQFALAPLELNELIEKEIKFFEMIPEFKYKVQKKLLLDPSIPRILGNPIQIKQILDNLLKNALDAMEDSAEKHLVIETTTGIDQTVIRISDSGHGIPQEYVDRIFRSDFTTKPLGKGTGIGLASVKSMVEAYSGTIEVFSEVGSGTTFTVGLPSLKPDLPIQ